MRRRSRWKIALATVLVLGLAVVVLTPAALERGPGRRWVERRLAATLGAPVRIDRLDLAWRGMLSAEGVEVGGAHLDVELHEGLWSLVTGSAARHVASVSGSIDVGDGDEPWDGRLPDWTLPDVPLEIHVDGLDVQWGEALANHALHGVEGDVIVVPGGAVDVHLRGTSRGSGAEGPIALTAFAERLVEPSGRLSWSGAGIEVDIEGDSLPIPLRGTEGSVGAFEMKLRTTNLAQTLHAEVALDTRLDGAGGTLDAVVALAEPLGDGNALAFELVRTTGTVSATNVPASLLLPYLEDTVVDPVRELAPRLDVDVTLAAPPERNFVVTATAPERHFEWTARVDDEGTIHSERLTVKAHLDPALARAVGVEIAETAAYRLELDTFVVPRPEPGEPAAAGISLAGTLEFDGPLAIRGAGGLTIGDAGLDVESERLGDTLVVKGRLRVDGAQADVDVAITDLLGAAAVSGRVRMDDTPEQVAARWLGDQAALPGSLLGRPHATIVALAPDDAGPAFTLTVEGPGGRVEARGTRGDDAWTLATTEGTVRIGPELPDLFRGDGALLPLAAPVSARITIGAVTVNDDGAIATKDVPVEVALDPTTIEAPDLLAGPLHLGALTARGSITPGPPGGAATLSLSGDVVVHGNRPDATLSRATFTFATPLEIGAAPDVAVTLADVSIAEVERVAGRAPGEVASVLGDGGRVTLTPGQDAGSLVVDAKLDRLEGRLRLTVSADEIRGDSDPITCFLDPARVIGALDTTMPVEIAQAVRATLTVRELRASRASGAGLRQLALVVDVAAEPFEARRGAQTWHFSDASGRVYKESGADRLSYGLSSRVRDATTPQSEGARIDVTGDVGSRAGDGWRLDPASATALVEAPATPVNYVAQLLGLEHLEEVVGPAIDVRGRAERRRIALALASQRGNSRGTLDIEPGVLTSVENPIELELEYTPALGEYVLRYIHPVLGDIREDQDRVRATVSGLRFPVDGDLTKLDLDAEILIGDVKLGANSALLAPVEHFATAAKRAEGDGRGVATVDATVEPIRITVRSGVLTYERFSITFGGTRLDYSGTIDLVQRTVDLKTDVPFKILGGPFRSIGLIPTGVAVPMRSHGPFDDVRTELQLEGLVGVVPRAILDTLRAWTGG